MHHLLYVGTYGEFLFRLISLKIVSSQPSPGPLRIHIENFMLNFDAECR